MTVALFLQCHKVLFATWKVCRWLSNWNQAWERIRLRGTRNSPKFLVWNCPNAFDHFRSSEDILDLRLQPCFHCWSPCLQSVWCVAILPPSPCTHLCLDTTYVAWQTVSGIKRSLSVWPKGLKHQQPPHATELKRSVHHSVRLLFFQLIQ